MVVPSFLPFTRCPFASRHREWVEFAIPLEHGEQPCSACLIKFRLQWNLGERAVQTSHPAEHPCYHDPHGWMPLGCFCACSNWVRVPSILVQDVSMGSRLRIYEYTPTLIACSGS